MRFPLAVAIRYSAIVSGSLEEVANRIARATRLTILTGAGMSAASGVPTFRGTGGLWHSFRAEDLATPEAFARDLLLLWQWYDWRRETIAGCDPNKGHEVVAAWSRHPGTVVITQNVDGLHERADTERVIRYHGSIWQMRCTANCGAPAWDDRTTPLPTLPPECPSCGAMARPGVVWFGEGIPRDAAIAAFDAAAQSDVFLSIGTSSLVYPAAGLLHEAKAHGAWTVEINPEPTAVAGLVDAAIAMSAEDALLRLYRS